MGQWARGVAQVVERLPRKCETPSSNPIPPKTTKIMRQCIWVLVAHAWNPSYSGGRDQEDHNSEPAWANSSLRSYLKKPFMKRAGGVALS
jgi:hypothetical protein